MKIQLHSTARTVTRRQRQLHEWEAYFPLDLFPYFCKNRNVGQSNKVPRPHDITQPGQ
jgi:hypothetical protein